MRLASLMITWSNDDEICIDLDGTLNSDSDTMIDEIESKEIVVVRGCASRCSTTRTGQSFMLVMVGGDSDCVCNGIAFSGVDGV